MLHWKGLVVKNTTNPSRDNSKKAAFTIPTMEYDPLKQLTDFFKSEGYVGKEAVEEAKAELERRHQRQLDLNQSADIDNTPGGKNFKLENMFSFSKSAFGSGMRMVQNDPLNALAGAAGVAGAVVTLVAAKNKLSFHRRGKQLVNRRSILSLRAKLVGSAPYIPRPVCTELIRPKRAVILQGPHSAGKSVFLAHHLLNQRYPWYLRALFPPYGFYLEGRVGAPSVGIWLTEQVSTASSENAWSVINDAIVFRASSQPVRTFLATHFPRLPLIFRPQPTFMVVDQAEELIQSQGAPFLIGLYELAKLAKDQPDTLQLFFVVNTNQAVESLQALNGGNLFTVVKVPRPELQEVQRRMDAAVAEVYKDVNEVIGVAISYAENEKPFEDIGSAIDVHKERRRYEEEYQAAFLESYGVVKSVKRADIQAAVRMHKDAYRVGFEPTPEDQYLKLAP